MTYRLVSKADAVDFTAISYNPAELSCSVAEPDEPVVEFQQATPAVPEPSQPLQKLYSFRLFSQCPLLSDPSSPSILFLEDIPLNQTVPLANFDMNDGAQLCMAEQLGTLLNGLKFDEANQKVHGKDYGHKPIFDTDLTAADARRRGAPNAILFFMYGEALTGNEIQEIFSGHEGLFETMKLHNFFVAETRGAGTVYRLNGLSLTSQKLPNRETIYLFNDLPARLNPHAIGEPTAQISGTSYFLLNRLMEDYQRGVKRSGVMADFGAGTGIQALALLKMYPQISEAISLEIDSHSMNLHRLNAMLNGVSDRVQVVDNVQPENFTAALAGREMDFAVSNPPFNIVPQEYENSFTHFGYGGDHGIDITKIFLDQAMPVLKKDGEFIYYSYLARNEKGNYFVTQYLKDHFKGLTLYYDYVDLQGRYFDVPGYAQALAAFMVEHGLSSEDSALAQDIQAKLKERGVQRLDERIGRIVNRGDGKPVVVAKNAVANLLESFDYPKPLKEIQGGERADMLLGGERIIRLYQEKKVLKGGAYFRKGGVYETFRELPQIQGGERFDRRGGVYLQEHVQKLMKDPKVIEKLCKEAKLDCKKILQNPGKEKK